MLNIKYILNYKVKFKWILERFRKNSKKKIIKNNLKYVLFEMLRYTTFKYYSSSD